MEDDLDFDVELDGAGVAGLGGNEEFLVEEEYEDLYDDVSAGDASAQQNPGTPKEAGRTWDQNASKGAAAENGASGQDQGPASKQDEQDPNDDGGTQVAEQGEQQQQQPQEEQKQLRLSPGALPGVMISDLHWWTTDAEVEEAIAEFGKVKGVKFIEERASGKSKGFCQVDFEDLFAAQLCKNNLSGRLFHGRPCVVQFANNQVLKQANKVQQLPQQQLQQPQQPQQQQQMQLQQQQHQQQAGSLQNQKKAGGTGGRGNGSSDSSRGSRGGNVRVQGGRGRGRGGEYGQMPMGMLGQGYDPASFGVGLRPGMFGMGFLPRGPGGYPMPFSGVPPGVAPHVNPAFFGRSNGGGMNFSSGWDGEAGDDEPRSGSRKKEAKDYREKDRDRERAKDKDRDRDRGYPKREKSRDDYDDDYGKRRRY